MEDLSWVSDCCVGGEDYWGTGFVSVLGYLAIYRE